MVRWAVVVAVTAAVVSGPTVVGLIPASGSSVTAAQLLARVQASGRVSYSGYAESTGSLSLPVSAGDLGSVADLLGSTHKN